PARVRALSSVVSFLTAPSPLSVPARRSSDLLLPLPPHLRRGVVVIEPLVGCVHPNSSFYRYQEQDNYIICSIFFQYLKVFKDFPDRKSTRLNSSHVSISYAAFGLKNKTTVSA